MASEFSGLLEEGNHGLGTEFIIVDQLVKITLPSFGWKFLNERLCVCCTKVSDGGLCAVTGMPEDQLAVGCSDCSVIVWKLERDTKKCFVRYQLLSLLTFIFQFQFCKLVVCKPFREMYHFEPRTCQSRDSSKASFYKGW